MNYADTASELTQRIIALGPQVLGLTDAWQLFKIPGFTCTDLEPSMAQADAALVVAQNVLRQRQSAEPASAGAVDPSVTEPGTPTPRDEASSSSDRKS